MSSENLTEDVPEITIQDIPVNDPEDNNEDSQTDISEEPESIPSRKDSTIGVEVSELYFGDDSLASPEELSLPAKDIVTIKDILTNLPNIDLTDSDEVRDWARILEDSMDKETFRSVYKKALENKERNFKQFVEFNGKKLAGAMPKVREDSNKIFKGNRAIVTLMSYLGRGIHFQVPLWNTGIWITFTAPSETEILELHRQLIADKIEMGRYTYGIALSNSISYTVDRLVDFALSHVHSTSLKLTEEDNVSLKDIIVAQDIHSLLWGMTCAMYPNGFKYSRACVENPEKCNHVTKTVLNISKLQFTDNTLLNDVQKAHMSDRQANSKNLESVKRYKEEHARFINKTVSLKTDSEKEISFTFTSPSISEYIEAGYKWINSMVELIENSVVEPENDQEKNKYIQENSKATTMRQYTHWVKEIEFNGNVINDKETIENTLNYLSKDSVLTKGFLKEVVNYIEESTISIIGIPNYTCPSCNAVQYETERNYPIFKEIIPLDPIMVFTDLIVERIEIITTR